MSSAASDRDLTWDHRALAILAGDAVGYSRLMEADEAGTHARMRELRVLLIDPGIVSHRGEVVKNTGDGFLASFDSAADAVECAVAIQERVTREESARPPDRQIAFRMGIHLDTVIVDAKDVFGRGVNVAARLQQQAEPGAVVISAAVRDLLRAQRSDEAVSLGELKLKNIVRPVQAFALARAGPPGLAPPLPDENRRARLPMLAVLPLRNLSFDPAYSYVADGVIEDIIVSLSGLGGLFVISRGSSLGLGADAAVDEIAPRVGVRYVLSGSVLPLPDRTRFTFELTDAGTGIVIWADRFEIGKAELFALQDHVVEQTVTHVAGHVRRSEITRAQRKRPEQLDAYDILLKALGQLYRFDFPSFSRARSLLQLAMEADPDYAAPYAYAAKWHIFNVGQGWSSDPRGDGEEAARLASLASERDPENSLAQALYGHAQGMLFRDYDAATEWLDSAIRSAPSNAWAWVLSSGTYGYLGDPSAVARAERALRLTPVDQQAFYFFCLLAQNHYLSGSYREAITWARKAQRHNPRFCNAIRILAASSAALGHKEEATAATAQLLQVQPRFSVSGYAPNCPLRSPEAVASYLDHLRLAGMPD
jgi:adenylate cyclase